MLADPWLFVDCETSPDLRTTPSIAKVRPPKNYTVEQSIREYKEKNAYKHWADEAKSRALAQVNIVCLALEDEPIVNIVSADERDVFDQLNKAWVQRARPSTWCAFYGMGFDFWILGMRAARHGFVDLSRSLLPRHPRYPDEHHRDPFLQLGNEGSLDEWAKFWTGYQRKCVAPPEWEQRILKELKRPSHDELQPFELARNGRPDLALGKCLEDVLMLRDHIVKPMRTAGLYGDPR